MRVPLVPWLVVALALAGALCPYPVPVPSSGAVFVVNSGVDGSTYELPFLPDANAAARRRLAGSFPYTVNWGDGTAADTCDNTVPCSHTYTTAGNYMVTLTGAKIVGFTTRDSLGPSTSCTDKALASGVPWYDSDGPVYNCAWYQLYENCPWAAGYAREGMIATDACCTCGGGNRQTGYLTPVLTSIQSWGSVRLHTTSGYHFARSVLTSAPPPLPASSGLRSLAHCLDGLDSLGAASLDVSALDTSGVTNLTDFASGAPHLLLVGLGGWDTSAVVDASCAFKGNTGPLAEVAFWNVSALEYAAEMFSGAQSFDADLSGWRPRRLRTFNGIFSLATAFRGRGVGAWSSENLANNSSPCGQILYGTRCTPPFCARPAWCYNAALIFEAQINVAVQGTYKQLFVLPTTDDNPLRVNYGDGRGWVDCSQADATTYDSNSICSPATNRGYATTGVYTLLIEGRLDGFLSMVNRGNEYRLKFQAIYSWGNVSLSSPPAYVLQGTLLSGVLSTTVGPSYSAASNALLELFYLAPTSGTNALARVTRADSLFWNAYELVGDLSDWRIPFNGSAESAFANAGKFNQDISAWPMRGITDTSYMFLYAIEFNQPLDSWGVSSTNMQSMFDNAIKFNQPLSSWNQRGTLTIIGSIFNGALAFNQPLGTWNVSALVTNFEPTGAGSPFRGCCRFIQDLSAWSRPTTLPDRASRALLA